MNSAVTSNSVELHTRETICLNPLVIQSAISPTYRNKSETMALHGTAKPKHKVELFSGRTED